MTLGATWGSLHAAGALIHAYSTTPQRDVVHLRWAMVQSLAATSFLGFILCNILFIVGLKKLRQRAAVSVEMGVSKVSPGAHAQGATSTL